MSLAVSGSESLTLVGSSANAFSFSVIRLRVGLSKDFRYLKGVAVISMLRVNLVDLAKTKNLSLFLFVSRSLESILGRSWV